MTRLLFALLIVVSAAGARAADGDIVKSNESIRVESGKTAGNLRTTNGAVTVGSGARVQAVATSNGKIQLDEKAEARELKTTNGAIQVDAQGRVSGGVSTTNNAIRLGKGAEVGGKAATTNGAIELDGAHVAGGIETSNGAVTIGPGSKVEGGIKTIDGGITVGAGASVAGGLLIETEDNSKCTHDCNGSGTTTFTGLLAAIFGSNKSDTTKPRVVIGPGAVVQGKLDFRREIDLYVSDRAKIGPVDGATAKTFAGDKP